MRLPRKGFSLRGMMFAVALVGILLGVIVSVRTQRLRRVYLGSVKKFVVLEELKRANEKYFLREAGRDERSMADAARNAAFSLKAQRALRNQTRNAARTPGSSGGYDDPSDNVIDLMQIGLEQAISSGKSHSGRAAQHRASAALAAKRASYFSQLKQKYEHATARPWLSVEPDPPAPE